MLRIVIALGVLALGGVAANGTAVQTAIFAALLLALVLLRRRRLYFGGSPEAPMFFADENDAQMKAAVQRARGCVGEFVARLEHPQPADSHFAVKVPIRDGDVVEHIWLADVHLDGEEFVGTIGNPPQSVGSIREGQTWRARVDEISDWTFVSADNKMFGNFTLKAAIPALPEARQVEARALFGDLS
jgi:uncharacterized protein YegJ (DUF2314 family)